MTAPCARNKPWETCQLTVAPWYSRFRFELQTESYSTYSTYSTWMWHQAAHLQDTATQPPLHFQEILCLLPQPPTHKNVGDASVPEALSSSHSVGLMHCHRNCHINFKEHMFSGWWYTYPSEKYQSVGMIIPNHQPVFFEDWSPGFNEWKIITEER